MSLVCQEKNEAQYMVFWDCGMPEGVEWLEKVGIGGVLS
jgi:hypothetical protein